MKWFNNKRVTLLGVLILLTGVGRAQLNLIPDPSFEDTTGTVNGWGTSSLKQWKNLDSNKLYGAQFTYLHYDSQNPAYSLPDNQWFYQHARAGFGIAALDFVWSNNPSFKRSVARTKLKQALIPGKTYCTKMYVNTVQKYYGFFTDGIAMYFDNGQLDTIMATDSLGVYPFVNPQVSNPSGNVISDTLHWIPIMGTFVANGSETHLTLGNFKTDAATTKVFIPWTFIPPDTVYASALLIDDVSVIPLDAANWLQDVSCAPGDSVYIGLPGYEMPDGMWYDINMNFLHKGSGFKVKATQWATQYIMQIDVCGTLRSDTLTVWSAPDGISNTSSREALAIQVYPNPSQGGFGLISNCEQACEVQIQVLGIDGRQWLRKNCNLSAGNCRVDTDIPSGTYLVMITTAAQQVFQRKLIIAR